ncbi:MAG: nucleotidyltransferase family protein [Wenzhouxiangellaceae bacterium]|nr:nucleotidyltransferase family protein [Wenzhouxiangellaceae bacterium]
MRAMILAAGRGERLRPLTDRTPKPLIEVAGRPLVVHHLEALARAGIHDIVINVSWLAERIESALGDGTDLGVRIRYSREPEPPLETAGGIVHALPLLGSAPFLVVNGDVWTDVDLGRVARTRLDGLAHLVLVDNPDHHPQGDFGIRDGRLALDAEPHWTFSGIGLYRPELFAGLAPGVRPLRPVLENAARSGGITAEHHTGAWTDVGTPERLEAVRSAAARRG